MEARFGRWQRVVHNFLCDLGNGWRTPLCRGLNMDQPVAHPLRCFGVTVAKGDVIRQRIRDGLRLSNRRACARELIK